MPPIEEKSKRFGDLTYQEIGKRAQQGWLAIIPTGCTEQQGPHLPVDFDTWFAETLMVAAAEKAAQDAAVQAVVLPAMPFGPTPEHRNFGSGFIDVPVSLHDALIEATLTSLVTQGFKRMVIWRGCGGHALNGVVERFNQMYQGKAQAFLPPHPFHEIWCRLADPMIPVGHADSFTTSISLYLRPETVRQEWITNPHSTEVDWNDPNLDFARYSSTGVIGDPTYASAELGKRLWEAVVEEAAQMLQEIVSLPLCR
ncbi:creatininase [Ktedonobacter sp. SOSP1-85]|uniref:creatininase family protein n=1 Tax=Ktedonobacter sp. SOSP1-85 TaxID=2778367 RepID=UPI001915C92E|nr:creatininase family protein [Ktedonobacter sp. SOSP1-85]GHO78370.1 creatininase [Ktedonobacter sp. SOSP1-85]